MISFSSIFKDFVKTLSKSLWYIQNKKKIYLKEYLLMANVVLSKFYGNMAKIKIY